MSHPQPTAADFFAQQHDEDEEIAEAIDRSLTPGPHHSGVDWQPGPLVLIPPDPMERIATALEALVDYSVNQGSGGVRPHTEVGPYAEAHEQYAAANEALQLSYEKLADTEDKLKSISEVLHEVEEALGKSTAKPALAAKAVIDAWRNPQVPVAVPLVVANPDGVEGHTRTQTDAGPDYCFECSNAAQDWREWPCTFVSEALGDDAANAIFVPSTVEEFREAHNTDEGEPDAPSGRVQPAHDAPVEVWREYARSLGFAGPEIDKANRSQVRTALGIAQPNAQAGA